MAKYRAAVIGLGWMGMLYDLGARSGEADRMVATCARTGTALNDVIDCMEGRLVEPKNSGRRVAVALEVEVALKQSSAAGGQRVDLPLADRSLGLNYDWYR